VFAHFLLKTLKENTQAYLLPSAIHERVKGGVAENAEQQTQHGTLTGTGGEVGGAFVLFLEGAGGPEKLDKLIEEKLRQISELQRREKEIAAKEEALAGLEKEIEAKKRKLAAAGSAPGDTTLDDLLVMADRKSMWERELERMREEAWQKKADEFEKGVAKYQRVAASGLGEDLKKRGWDAVLTDLGLEPGALRMGDAAELCRASGLHRETLARAQGLLERGKWDGAAQALRRILGWRRGDADATELLKLAERKGFIELSGHTAGVDVVVFSPDGGLLATGGNSTRLWSMPGARYLRTLEGGNPGFSRDGRFLVTRTFWKSRRWGDTFVYDRSDRQSGETFSVDIWSVLEDKRLLTLGEMEKLGRISANTPVMFSPDGNLFAAAMGGPAQLWSVPDGKLVATLSKWRCPAQHIAFSPDSRHLATWDWRTALFWSIADRRPVAVLRRPPDTDWDIRPWVCFDPDWRHIAWFGSVWSVAGGEQVLALEEVSGAAVFSPDGWLVAAPCKDNTVRLWSVPDGERVATLEGASGTVLFTHDGRHLLTGGTKTAFWTVPEGRRAAVLDAPSSPVTFSPDGGLLVTTGGDQKNSSIRLWSVPDGKLLAELAGASGPFAFSPDGRYLATGGPNSTARLWLVPAILNAPAPPAE
jgi:WD40 repeat protein